MIIDCDTCVARDLACDDCVISVLLGPPGASAAGDRAAAAAGEQAVDLDAAERAALGTLADAGLVPRLRLVPVVSPRGREIA